jgi:hypothetical protein
LCAAAGAKWESAEGERDWRWSMVPCLAWLQALKEHTYPIVTWLLIGQKIDLQAPPPIDTHLPHPSPAQERERNFQRIAVVCCMLLSQWDTPLLQVGQRRPPVYTQAPTALLAKGASPFARGSPATRR